MDGLDSLDLFDFGILLQALANNQKVGVLKVRSEPREKFLQLDRNKLLCIYTPKPRVSLEKVLYNHRAIEKAALREAIEEVQAHPERGPLAEHLVASGRITREQLRRAHYYQMVEEVLELFYWKSVGFKFLNGGTRDDLPDGRLVTVGEPVEVDSILIQCTKTIDDVAKFDEVTPSLRDVYELHVDSLDTLKKLVPDPAQREFVLLLDGVRDMREVLRDMRMNRFEVLEFFYRFREAGLIRPKNAFELLMLAENRRKEFSLEKRARVLERVNELGVEGFAILLPLAETYEEMGEKAKAAALYARHARRCLDAGDAKGAFTSVSRATRLVPADPSLREFEVEVLIKTDHVAEAGVAYKALAAIREAHGDRKGALSALEQAARLHPADPDTWSGLAELLEKAGKPRLAAARLRRAGDALRGQGDHDGAADAWRRALAHCPGAWSLRYRLVETYHAQGRDDLAVQTLADLLPLVAEGLPQLDADARMRHLVHIEDCLRRTGGLVSSAAMHLGRVYAKLGAADRAADVYRAAAEALAGARRPHAVVEALSELIELAPNDLEARKALARAHEALGDTNRALGQLRRVATHLMGEKRWPDARDVYQEMVRIDPGCADAHCGLAQAHLHLDEAKPASEYYHRAALLHRAYGRAEAAVPYLREAVEKNPADAELLEEYCELLLGSDRRDETVRALSALVELHMAHGAPARAAIALTRILEREPRHPGAKQVLQEAARQLSRLAEDSEELSPEAAKALVEEARTASS